MTSLKYWASNLRNSLSTITSRTAQQGNKVFSLALMQLILSQVLSDFNTILTQKSECLQGAINVESILIK